MNRDTIKNEYAMFEVIPLEEVDFRKYGEYSITCDKSIPVKYMVIHEIKLILVNRKTEIGGIIGHLTKEEFSLNA